MRLIVFYDLPTLTKYQSFQYSVFHRFLVQNGFYMIQYSIYARLCQNHYDLATYIKKVKKNLPKEGDVRLLSVTEKQYSEMEILLGELSVQEQFENLDYIAEL